MNRVLRSRVLREFLDFAGGADDAGGAMARLGPRRWTALAALLVLLSAPSGAEVLLRACARCGVECPMAASGEPCAGVQCPMAGASHGPRTIILPVGIAVLASPPALVPFVTSEEPAPRTGLQRSDSIVEPPVEPPRTLAFPL